MELKTQSIELQRRLRELSDDVGTCGMHAETALALALVCAELADNARRRCDARDMTVRYSTLHDYNVRYGADWVKKNMRQVHADSGIRVSRDPLFKDAAAANEMYGRWANMYSQLATALSSADVSRQLKDINDALTHAADASTTEK